MTEWEKRPRVRGWCVCEGWQVVHYRRRKILDTTEAIRDAGIFALGFITAHGEHDGFRLVVER